ncbi:MAG: 3-deoxy-D-manno-octulosonic acid transferase [Rhodospirillaceae bacterium]|nr:3-deoxy-D-manno-octulosonic acid transferase [Rhodospirillaceae bacterium]
MLLNLYAGLGQIMPPAARLILAHRRARGKEHPDRIAERMGFLRRERPEGPLIWLHAASLGEASSVLPLIDRLLAKASLARVMMTTGTVTSARVMEERLPSSAYHQFVPVDCPAWVERFLDGAQPDMALWVESELWPNLLRQTARRQIPMVLVNGRLSARSFAHWQRMPRTIRRLLKTFKLVLAQSEAHADRFRILGADAVAAPGNLKLATPPLQADPAALNALKVEIGDRAVWLASSTHPDEENQLAVTHQAVRNRYGDALLIIAPRHPGRGPEIAAELYHAGSAVALRSAGDRIKSDTAIYVADTLDELGLFYRLAPIAFVGGSLVPHGGQNLIEAAQLNCALLHGPHVDNFAEIADLLETAGGSQTVDSLDALTEALIALLDDPAAQAMAARNAEAVARERTDVLDRVMDHLAPFLAPFEGTKDY